MAVVPSAAARLARARALKRLETRLAELERMDKAITEAGEKRDSWQERVDKLGARKLIVMADIDRLNTQLDGMR